MPKPSIVIEIRGGALAAAYANQDVELILVDYDEGDGYAGASAVVEPDKTEEMPAETRRLAADAKERAHV